MPRNAEVIRQWKLLLHLDGWTQAVSVDELAGELHVSKRTVWRDLAALQEVGFPQLHGEVEARSEGAEMIRKRLVRAVDEGELSKGLPIAEIAGFYSTFMQGMAVRARDGATRAAMLSWVNAAMAAWPPLTKVSPAKVKKTERRP